MAKNNTKNGNKNDDKDPTNTGKTDPALEKSKRKKLLIMILVVISLVAVSVGATLVLVTHFAGPVSPEVENTNAADPAVAVKKPAIYYPMQPVFVVNFESQGRQRFLQVEVNLLLREQDVIPVLELHMPAIRNSLVMLFSGQVYEDLRTADGKEKLRQEALLGVQSVLQKEMGKPGVEQILFTNFVMQ
jgi:flagellar FliL protein